MRSARPLPSLGLLFAASCLAALTAGADTLVSDGYREAVFSVTDADAWADTLVDVGAWQQVAAGEVDRRLLDAWQLPDDASARYIVLGNPGTTRGYVRLIEFDGVEQRQIRSNAQSWDTGGWFDVNSRVLDMDATFAALQSRDWQAYSDPVQFTFGPFVVIEWLARGPDGIVIATIERVEPPLEGFPQIRGMSRLINATQIVPDIDRALTFYRLVLGFSPYLSHEGASKVPGPNVLGLPHNVAAEVPRRVIILHPQGTNDGSVELLQFEGAVGADFSEYAVPPNLGILMLRFPVQDIMAFAAQVAHHTVDVVMPIVTVDVPPYGTVRMMAIRGPGGVWIEFFEEDAPQ